MSYVQGADRNQVMLLPTSVEDYITYDENPVRALDAFVDSLDLAKLGFKMAGGNAKGGRPPFHPGTLLKLYLWGYFARILSSRRLEEACTCNLNAIWLIGNLAPDHSTISDFRKTNPKVLKSIRRQFNLLCLELQLFGRELIAIDGTFIQVLNSRRRSVKAKLEKLKINFHRDALNENAQRLKSEPLLYRKRAALVERPFGTIKDWNGRRDLLCKGLGLAGAETRLSVFTCIL